MKPRRTDVSVEDLGSGIYRINEYDFANCFLVIGENAACLIDACAGIADIGAVARSLTEKPLTVLITHAHADHIGGAVWFPEVYIHPEDFKRGESYKQFPARMYFLYCHRFKKKSHKVRYADAFQKDYNTKLLPVNEGDTFDLGGRTIETYFTPGHSTGSVTFRDSLTGTLFAGDNVNPMVTLQFPGGTTVKEWIPGAEKTLALAGEAPVWGGHGNAPVPRETLQTAISLAKELVQKGNETPGRAKTKRGDEKYPCIIYKTDKVI